MDRLTYCRKLPTVDLIERLETLAAEDRRCDSDILAHIGELDSRRALEERGYPSLYAYCIARLKFPESTAYWRIHAARAARAYPGIFDLLDSGELNVATLAMLTSVLTDANHLQLIQAARGKSRKEVEALIASLQPSASRRDLVTRHGPLIVARAQWPAPPPTAATPGPAPTALDIVEAIDAERRRLHFDVGPETAQLLERAREILRHKFPFASLEDIVREALNVLLDCKDLDRAADRRRSPGQPESNGAPSARRAIPMWVRRAVWKRDAGRCSFVGEGGKSCGERSWLEFDHVLPFAKGGRSDDPSNVRLLCRAHNQLEASRAFAPPRGQETDPPV